MDPLEFEKRKREYVRKMAADGVLQNLTRRWFKKSSKYEY